MLAVRRIVTGALAAIGLAAAPAAASPVLELAGGITGGGFNARAVGSGIEAAYFNPSLLPLGKDRFDASVFVLGDNLTIDLEPRPAGTDVAPSIYDAWLGDGTGGLAPLEDKPLATEDLAPRHTEVAGALRTYLAIGLIKRLVEDKVVFGLLAVLPTDHLQSETAFFNDEREQYFSNALHYELLGDRLEQITLAFALGGRINDSLAVGFGFTTGLETTTTTPVYVPDGSDLGNVVIDSDLAVDVNLSPHFGVVATPWRRVTFTTTLHAPTQVTINGKNYIQVANGVTKTQEFQLLHGYEPLTVALGGAVEAWSCGGRELTLAGTAEYRTWSSYLDRHGESPADPWHDTYTLALGGRYRNLTNVYYADATYVPSPVPTQNGRSNYVDNPRMGIDAGVIGVTHILGVEVHGGFQLQAHRLFARTTHKDPGAANPVLDEYPDNAVDPTVDPTAFLPEAQGLQTNNPGYPGYSSRGWLFGAGVTLSAEL